jgi:ribosome-associated protein
MQQIEINREPIELFKILKFEGLVDSGAHAKQVIAEGLVSVNGEQETRKSRKMYNGDQLSFAGQDFTLQLAPA